MASRAQWAKVALHVCAVCGTAPCVPGRLTPRDLLGCDDADCVIALCRIHEYLFERGRLDLLPHLSGRGFNVELAHMQGHYDDPVSVVQRLSGMSWKAQP